VGLWAEGIWSLSDLGIKPVQFGQALKEEKGDIIMHQYHCAQVISDMINLVLNTFCTLMCKMEDIFER
jgi:hypothetical protein